MADFNSDLYQPPSSLQRSAYNTARLRGKARNTTVRLDVPTGLDPNDKGFLVEVPSNFIMKPESTIYHDALTTGVIHFGDANTPNALIDGASVGTAGNIPALDNKAHTDYGKRLWEMLMYSSDPRTAITLFITFGTPPTAAGFLTAELRFSADN